MYAWFVYLIRSGLTSWFDADDLMNLHYYWVRPWSALLKANVMFWSSYYRPGGGLFYRALYATWGFHPLPFRIAAFILLSVNFVLLGVVVRQLTGSRWAALIALMMIGANPSFSAAYFDTGAIYDVLSDTFYWSAFAFYVHFRRANRLPGWVALAGIFCLFVAALDAKEIAVSLPLAVGLYEVIWHPPATWKPGELWRWILREGRFPIIGALADIGYVAGKRYGPDSLWTVGAYQPHYSAAIYFQSMSHYLHQLISKPVTTSPWLLAALLTAMLAVAAIGRKRCLIWGLGFVVVSMLPLAFIPPRGGFAYLVPSVGWAVYGGGLLAWAARLVVNHRPQRLIALQGVLFVLLFARVAPPQRKWLRAEAKTAHEMQARYRNYIEQIRALIPAPRKGASILLQSDAEGRDDYDVFFVIRLYFGDPTLNVQRGTLWRSRHVTIYPEGYDYVLDWVDNRFVLVSHK